MRMRDGAEHVEKERNPRAHAEPAIVAIFIDRLALDELEYQVRLAVGRDAGIDEVGDVGMGDPGEDGGLATESGLRPVETGRQQVDGCESFELSIAALGEPDDPHPPDRSARAVYRRRRSGLRTRLE